MKKILTTCVCLCFVVNISFAFDPYADDEPETKSKTKLYCGIAMTLIGGFLAYDGFSQEEVDISKPSVDYGGSINAMWVQNGTQGDWTYHLYSGEGKPEGAEYDNAPNRIYNNGNVELTNVKIYVRYRYDNSNVIGDKDDKKVQNLYHYGDVDVNQNSEGYFLASGGLGSGNDTLSINEGKNWSDYSYYNTAGTDAPYDHEGSNKVLYDENALKLVNVKVTYDYKKKYRKQNKSDLEGVMGLMVATAGIYFIVDYLWDLHKFNMYMKRNDMKIKLANTPNEYKLVFQKRL